MSFCSLDPSGLYRHWFYCNQADIKDGHVFTAPVGRYQANAFELQDMHGNVWEWCSDWYGDYKPQPSTNPLAAKVGSHRVYRGGGWDYTA